MKFEVIYVELEVDHEIVAVLNVDIRFPVINF